MSGRRYLVTGASGFIGSAVARALVAAGHETHGVSAAGRQGPSHVTMHRCDLRSADQIRALLTSTRPTHLINAAWDVTHGSYWTSVSNFDWLIAGTRLLAEFAQHGLRAVGVGTCAEYEWSRSRYDENVPLLPATTYGRCKVALFQVHEAARLRGLSTAWARLFFPYGPGDNPARFIPSLVTALRARTLFEATDRAQIRDFIHVNDVAAALVALAQSEVTGPVNVGTGVGVSLGEVARQVAAAMDVDPGLVRFGARPTRLGEPAELVAVTKRMTAEVGYEPALSLGHGIATLL